MFGKFVQKVLSLPFRRSAKANLNFTQLGMGCGPIGNYPKPLSDVDAKSTVNHAIKLGIRVFDTAPLYGYGLSETRLGEALASSNIPRDELLISSKVGRILVPDSNSKKHDLFPDSLPFKDKFDYSYEGIKTSIENSLKLLQTDYLDVAHVHDLGKFTHGNTPQEREMLHAFVTSGYQALLEYRQKGTIKAIGLGVNECEIALELMQKHNIDFDCIMLAQSYNLLEQSEKSTEFFAECKKRKIAVMIGAPLGSGLLSGNPLKTSYRYAEPSSEILSKKDRIEAVCEKHGVTIQQAALAYVLLQDCVTSAVMGARSPGEIEQGVDAINKPVPVALWEELKSLELISYQAQTVSRIAMCEL
jgi:D-threo-aldose 1-dehydrogenase